MFKNILVPIDLEETARASRAIDVAEEMAQRYGAEITALTAIPDFGMSIVANHFPQDAVKKAHKAVCDELQKFVDGRFSTPAKVHCSVGQGNPHKIIVQYAKEHGIDLVVMPAHVRELGNIFLGSNSSHVVARASCSVIVVR